DIGGADVADTLSSFKPLRAVYGNIDDQKIRLMFPKINIFTVENVKVMMTHIGGYPNHYEPGIKELIIKEKPNIFISGHSHILKVMNDHSLNLLHINPGAAGNSGFHRIITMVRFQIDGNRIEKMEVYEKARK
ncbi:MAG: metallophosphoesterase family protein, partial [Bacteroidales bacterium]|nr:metallophosphoesterase family protein [Bacteroidales bacterium]